MDKSHNHIHEPNLPNQQTAVPPIYEWSLLFASISQFFLFDLLDMGIFVKFITRTSIMDAEGT